MIGSALLISPVSQYTTIEETAYQKELRTLKLGSSFGAEDMNMVSAICIDPVSMMFVNQLLSDYWLTIDLEDHHAIG